MGRFDDFAREFRIGRIPVTAEHLREVPRARPSDGQPHHPAGLNFGGCVVYGVAWAEQEALLVKRSDGIHTHIEPAQND